MAITKDSGQRQEFATGARRDTEEGKPLFHHIPFKVMNEMQKRFGVRLVVFSFS